MERVAGAGFGKSLEALMAEPEEGEVCRGEGLQWGIMQ